jgi:hypothetical protein
MDFKPVSRGFGLQNAPHIIELETEIARRPS